VLAFVTWSRAWGPLDRRDVRDALLIGVPNTAIFFGLWFVAAVSVPPGQAAVLVYTFPLWVTLLSAILLRTAPSGLQVLAVAGGFIGVVFVSQPWLSGGAGLAPLPVLELLGGALSWGVGTVAFKRRFPGPKVAAANGLQLVGGAATLFGVSLLAEGPHLPAASWPEIGIVLWLGIVGTALAYSIWFRLLDRRSASTLSGYTFLVPVVALTASTVFLGERVDPIQALGVALVLLALYGNARGARGPSRSAPV
jgi:probable blue pigment (indigoidine) exporter